MKLVAKKVPRLSVAYLNASEIFENNRAGIQRMKHLFGRSISSVENGQLFRTNNEEKKEVIWSEKYRHDLFYILPFYHRELHLHVKKLIVLDADLEFRTDILDLYRQFRCLLLKLPRNAADTFCPDTSVRVRWWAAEWRKHPFTENIWKVLR